MKAPIMNNSLWMQEVLRLGNTGLWTIIIDSVHNKYHMHADETMLELLGLSEELEAEACYNHWFSRVDAQYVDYVTESVSQMIETGKCIEVEYPWHHPKWGTIYVRCGGKVDHKDDRGIIHIVGYHQNIDELEQMKRENELRYQEMEEIRHQRKTYNDLFNSVLCGIITYTYEEEGLVFKKFNQEALRVFQYTKEEFKNHGPWKIEELVASDDLKRFCNSMKLLKKIGDKTDREIRFKTRYGSKVWVIERTELIVDTDGDLVYQSVFINNDENKKKSLMLEEITENVPGGVCLLDVETKQVLYGNEGFYHLYGCSQKEMKEIFHDNAGRFFREADLLRLDRLVSNAVKTGKKSLEYERQILRRDDIKIWVLVKGTIIQVQDTIQLSCVLIDITDRKEMEYELYLNERRLNFVLEQTVNVVFDYDVLKHKMVLKNGHLGEIAIEEELVNPAEILVEKGILHKDYKEDLQELFERMEAGEESASKEILIRYNEDDSYIWTNAVLRSINFGDQTSWAVGVFEDISLRKSAEMAFNKEKKYRQAMLADTLATAEINLTKNIVEKTSGIWKRRLDSTIWIYDELMEITINHVVHPEDRHHYISLVSREAMMKLYGLGSVEVNCEHRRVSKDGEVNWRIITAHLLKDPISGDLKALMYLRDIDERKKEELAMIYQSQRDSLTGLYNKKTAEERMNEIILEGKGEEENYHAFIIIDLDYFKMINDTFGHQYGDEVLERAGEILREIFRSDDILGRLGGDELVVFMKNVTSRIPVERKLHLLAEEFGKITRVNHRVTASIGVAFWTEHGHTVEQLYQNADIALYQAKAAGRNCFRFFEPNMTREP